MTLTAYPRGNQAGQDSFLSDISSGWTLFQAGLGSGKSWAAARKLLYLHAVNQCPSLAVAPTWGDLWRFVVPAIVAAAEDWRWPVTIRRGDPPHLMVGGQIIHLLSADHPQRFAGFEVGALWIDEAARIPSSPVDPLRDAPTQIRSRLRHPSARVRQGMITTTPEGVDTWVQRDWFDSPKPGHRAYRGKTSGNSALPADYIESLRGSLPAELLRQYLDGEAVSYAANRAHPTFMAARHVKESQWRPFESAHIGADYNVSPLCWVIGQKQADGTLAILDELVVDDFATVDTAISLVTAKGWAHETLQSGARAPRTVIGHPDRSAKNRTTTGDPQWTTMQNAARSNGWTLGGSAFGANPQINSRINLVSMLLVDGTGKSRLSIHPRCVRLIDELGRTSRLPNGYDPGPGNKRGHILDALGYLCWDLFAPGAEAGVARVGA